MNSVQLNPLGPMSQLSQLEIDRLQDTTGSDLHQLFRNCCLAVLNSGALHDDLDDIFLPYQDFEVELVRRERGVKIELINPPAMAFVDGQLLKGVHEHLFAVLRDLLHMGAKYPTDTGSLTSMQITDMVFDVLRHAEAIQPSDPDVIVCWGGHSIDEIEYKYTKEVGYELGLRQLNICTGCGPGAMKGPMKGATIGHAKQRHSEGRYIGVTEPSIIAAEPPNAIVNELVILPDIEKRLEAFVRIAHGIVIFPGGAGTAEELLYILGIMLHPKNAQQKLPIILTGPEKSKGYFEALDNFIGATLGPQAQACYEIIVNNPAQVAQKLKHEQQAIREYRKHTGDAFPFNWSLHIESDFQTPFIPTHQSMAALDLHFDQDKAVLASALRKAFSGIVAGNIKAEGVKQIKLNGPFVIDGDKKMMSLLDTLLTSFVEQGRMKLPGSAYTPCYKMK